MKTIKNDRLDSEINNLLLFVASNKGEEDFAKNTLERIKQILAVSAIRDIIDNLSPPSRQQTPLVEWVKDIFREVENENE